jgi:hypothetical protein
VVEAARNAEDAIRQNPVSAVVSSPIKKTIARIPADKGEPRRQKLIGDDMAAVLNRIANG